MIRITAAEMRKIRAGNCVVLRRAQNKALKALRECGCINVYTGFPPNVDVQKVKAVFNTDKTFGDDKINYCYRIEVTACD